MKKDLKFIETNIHKPIFWIILFLIALLYAGVVIQEGGFSKNPYAVCNVKGGWCENPFYNTSICEGDKYPSVCISPVFQGEIGKKPGALYNGFPFYAFGLVALGIFINQLIPEEVRK